MSKVISFNLSVSGINRAIKEINAYRQELKLKEDMVMQELATVGAGKAVENIMALRAVESYELAQSIRSRYSPRAKTTTIKTSSEHAMFVEFGTGMVGKYGPKNPAQPSGWVHDINNHEKRGRSAPGWIYYDPKFSPYHTGFRWTAGQPARPYMYHTAMWLRDNIRPIAKGVYSL